MSSSTTSSLTTPLYSPPPSPPTTSTRRWSLSRTAHGTARAWGRISRWVSCPTSKTAFSTRRGLQLARRGSFALDCDLSLSYFPPYSSSVPFLVDTLLLLLPFVVMVFAYPCNLSACFVDFPPSQSGRAASKASGAEQTGLVGKKTSCCSSRSPCCHRSRRQGRQSGREAVNFGNDSSIHLFAAPWPSATASRHQSSDVNCLGDC